MSSLCQEHPAQGMLSFSRVHGGDPKLFGSSVQHNDKITLTLKHGVVERHLNRDWYHGRDTMFEVEMSYTQFAELISAMNAGDGVPVTIRYVAGQGNIEPVDIVDKRSQFVEEFESECEASSLKCKELISIVQSSLMSGKQLAKLERQEMLSLLNQLHNAVDANNRYALAQFNEAMENIVTEAKGEVEAFGENKLHQIALAAVSTDPDILMKPADPVVALPDTEMTYNVSDTISSNM